MASPEELANWRAAALNELTLRLGRLPSAALDPNSTEVAAAVYDFQGRVRAIEGMAERTAAELAGEARRAAAARDAAYGSGSASGPARTAGGQFQSSDEARVQQVMSEMRAKGLDRI